MLSFSPLITLFRHALMAAGETRPATTQAALEAVAQRFSCDMSAFRDLLEVREHRKRQREVPLRDLTQRFVAAVEHVAAAADRILESSRSS